MRGFEDYVRDQDPEGTWSRAQVEGMKRCYKAGWDAAQDKTVDMKKLKDEYEARVIDVMTYFNQRTGKALAVDSGLNFALVAARLKEGATVEQLKSIIDYAVREWAGTKYEEHTRPRVLFGSKDKILKYLDHADSTKPVEAVEVVKKKASLPKINR